MISIVGGGKKTLTDESIFLASRIIIGHNRKKQAEVIKVICAKVPNIILCRQLEEAMKVIL